MKTSPLSRRSRRPRSTLPRDVRRHSGVADEAIDISAFFKAHVRELRITGDNFAWGCCPFHRDQNPSFSMNLQSGWFSCMSTSCAVSGRGAVSFAMRLYGMSGDEAKRYVEDWR